MKGSRGRLSLSLMVECDDGPREVATGCERWVSGVSGILDLVEAEGCVDICQPTLKVTLEYERY